MIRSIALSLVIGVAPFTASAENTSPNYVLDKHGKQPIPVVAIDNVCAWPNLTLMRNGTIVATIHNQPSHLKDPGDVECWASTDHGNTWTKRGISAPRDDEKAARGMFAAGVSKNDELIVISTGHSDPVAPNRGQILPTWVSRSKDGGKTWTIDKDRFPRGPEHQPLNPYGDIAAGADGNLHVAAYNSKGTFIFTSRDDGITWGDPSLLSTKNPSNETALFHLGGDRWLAAARSTHLDLYGSDDDTSTWAHLMKLTANAEVPGHITRISCGLLVSYGNRNVPRGIDVRFGNNEGTTWSESFRVLDCGGDIGYPGSLQLPDGQVLTAYYAQRIVGHDRYHMGVVVWDPERTQTRAARPRNTTIFK
ncbi:MAG: glycoside hydrolase [Fuerstiella sp.]|nr:glycoside hydrolase [Fuerstiella sp.]